MVLDWRATLRTLLTQFEARAARSTGLHLFVEVANDERNKMLGPPWFSPLSSHVHVIDGKLLYTKWDVSASGGLPGISPGFRALTRTRRLTTVHQTGWYAIALASSALLWFR